jgi:hypothetical protein
VGNLMDLATGRRGEFVEMRYLTDARTTLVFDLPLAEVVTDYFDQLKSRSKGYASMEYKVTGYRKNDLVLLEVKINGEPAPPLSAVVHKDAAMRVGRALCLKLKEAIPRQMFRVPIQACVGAKVIASEAIQPYRKDVLAKCYGAFILFFWVLVFFSCLFFFVGPSERGRASGFLFFLFWSAPPPAAAVLFAHHTPPCRLMPTCSHTHNQPTTNPLFFRSPLPPKSKHKTKNNAKNQNAKQKQKTQQAATSLARRSCCRSRPTARSA